MSGEEEKQVLDDVVYNYDDVKVVKFDGMHIVSITRLGKRITRVFLYDHDYGPDREEIRRRTSGEEEYILSIIKDKVDVKRVHTILVLDDFQLKELARLGTKAFTGDIPSELDPERSLPNYYEESDGDSR